MTNLSASDENERMRDEEYIEKVHALLTESISLADPDYCGDSYGLDDLVSSVTPGTEAVQGETSAEPAWRDISDLAWGREFILEYIPPPVPIPF